MKENYAREKTGFRTREKKMRHRKGEVKENKKR